MTDGTLSFVMFNYGLISWTTGTLSGGDARTGLGGNAAGVSRRDALAPQQTDRATRYVSRSLVNCCTTVETSCSSSNFL